MERCFKGYLDLEHKGATSLKAIDLFSGIGGMRIAAENEGFETVFSSEVYEGARKIYQDNFGELPSGDIAKIHTEDIPDHDLLLAGFPCQPFSVSGKRLGFEDTRGTLFFEIARILEKKAPEFVLLENVSGLVGHDNGRTFRRILSVLGSLGYATSSTVLNAIDFGLPQNRARTIIVASKSAPHDEFVDLTPPLPKFRPRLRDFLDGSPRDAYLREEEYTLLPENQRVEQSSGLVFAGYINKPKRKNGTRPDTEHLSRVHRQHNRIYSTNGVSPTLSSGESSGRDYIYDGLGVRKLTVDEAFRIMGFPATFKRDANRTILRRTIGNSVPIPMVQEVIRRIIQSTVNFDVGQEIGGYY